MEPVKITMPASDVADIVMMKKKLQIDNNNATRELLFKGYENVASWLEKFKEKNGDAFHVSKYDEYYHGRPAKKIGYSAHTTMDFKSSRMLAEDDDRSKSILMFTPFLEFHDGKATGCTLRQVNHKDAKYRDVDMMVKTCVDTSGNEFVSSDIGLFYATEVYAKDIVPRNEFKISRKMKEELISERYDDYHGKYVPIPPEEIKEKNDMYKRDGTYVGLKKAIDMGIESSLERARCFMDAGKCENPDEFMDAIESYNTLLKDIPTVVSKEMARQQKIAERIAEKKKLKEGLQPVTMD